MTASSASVAPVAANATVRPFDCADLTSRIPRLAASTEAPCGRVNLAAYAWAAPSERS